MKLQSLERLGWRFGLESITALLKELGNPQDFLRVIHVAGSNGKGSTCAFLDSYLRASGFKTGLYTSPHLSDIRERFRIDGTWIGQGEFQKYLRVVLEASVRTQRKEGHLPTHFEALTALAFLWFKEKKVDWVVLETGLGGRLDATNVVAEPTLCLVTPIGLEHQEILGKGLVSIAREKAGILKRGSPGVTLQTSGSALRALQKSALEKGVSLWAAGKNFHWGETPRGFWWKGPGLKARFQLGEFSGYQAANAALAVAGIARLGGEGLRVEPALIQKALSRTHWPGRLEIWKTQPFVLGDGAHNPAGAKALAATLNRRYPGKKWIVLNGYLRDKDHEGVVEELRNLAALSIVTPPESERASEGLEVFQAWERKGVRSLWVRDWKKALGLALGKARLSPQTPLLVTGSLYLLGDCRRELLGLRGLDLI